MTPTQDRARTGGARAGSDEVSAWAASGAMALTGRAGCPALGPPEGLVSELRHVATVLEDRARGLGGHVTVEPLTLLGERAAIRGLSRHGSTSCGGATRLLRGGDGWLAVSLARRDDVELLPAWLERDVVVDDPWPTVAEAVASTPAADLVARAVLLGLPVAHLPTEPPARVVAPEPLAPLPIRATELAGPPAASRPLPEIRIVDLTSLWAGPLCGSLLASAGADVVKVESTSRPDGARRGPAELFDLLNAGKRSVALDLREAGGRSALTALIAGADVVIEASRPRALEQLGVDARRVLGGGRPRVWASITGHGRAGTGRDRVAFGDDAAVAGGLVCWDDEGPCFCADAVADPTSGLVAAAAILDALAVGGRWLLDVSMAAVAARLSGPTLLSGTSAPAPPRARTPSGRAAALGEHTEQVLAELTAP